MLGKNIQSNLNIQQISRIGCGLKTPLRSRRRRNRLLLRGARDQVNRILRNHDEILVDLKNLLDDRRVLLLRTDQHLLLRGRVLAQEGTALVCIVVIIQHNGLVLLHRKPGSMLQGLLIG